VIDLHRFIGGYAIVRERRQIVQRRRCTGRVRNQSLDGFGNIVKPGWLNDIAWELVANHSLAEREALRREVPRAALRATLGGRRLQELALELIRNADAGLARLSGGEADRPLLAPLWGYAAAGRTPADDMLADFDAARGDPAKLIPRWELHP